MPSTYAHERFGCDVLKRLPERERAAAEQAPGLFHLGLQGPDLFFYYKPLNPGPVSRIGNAVHQRPGLDFAVHAAQVAAEHDWALPYLAYTYGSICHFALDRACHYDVFDYTRTHGAAHSVIEGELDRALLLEDGKDPVRADLVENLHPDPEDAQVIAAFYSGMNLGGSGEDGFTMKQMKSAIWSFIRFNHILTAPGKGKRFLIFSGMKAADKYEELRGHVIGYEEDPACREVLPVLRRHYEEAIPEAVRLIRDFRDSAEGRIAWDPLYEMNYESDYRRRWAEAGITSGEEK
ncbi:MAG: hypothetical protein IKF45_01115 [Lachnospiraceae bacterium]|nr:hypothetical protein [Lachnospiraceae bacterium]